MRAPASITGAAPIAALLATDELTPRALNSAAATTVQPGLALTRIDISAAGQLLGRLLLAAQNNGQTPLQAMRPLLAAPMPDAPQLATAMREAVEFSGVFYESHLNEWHIKGRSSEAILREPQARLATDTPIDAAPLASIVQSQLDTLETRQIHWQGQAWPGAGLQFSIEEYANAKEKEENTQTAPDKVQWQSRVSFTLPGLGTVRAHLHLQADRLQLALHTDNAASAALLRAGSATLSQTLQACGTQLEQLSAQSDDES